MSVFLIIPLLLTEVVIGSERISEPRTAQSDRIFNGVTAKPEQFKYQVGLSMEKEGKVFTSCGGTLIAPTWILTAAHCIEGALKVYAFLGNSNYRSGTRFFVIQGIIHGKWDQHSNDIALLRIPVLDLGPNIAPVKLPPLNELEKSYIYENVIATGWGLTNDSDTSSASELQYARLRVIPSIFCLKLYGSNVFKNTNICALGPRRSSTCRGDSGGPLVTESSGVLVGITSYGASAGCTQGFPSAFTRVSSFRSWIKDISGV